jgi:hypothetical protein
VNGRSGEGRVNRIDGAMKTREEDTSHNSRALISEGGKLNPGHFIWPGCFAAGSAAAGRGHVIA